MKKLILLTLATILANIAFSLEISLPAIFADGMVLQRNQPVPVWGSTEAGANVTVSFAGQSKSTTANEDGTWMLRLDALKASEESRVLNIAVNKSEEKETLNIKDVLVGEVWLASGQSNMYRPFRMLIGPAREPKYEPIAEYLRQEENTANDPLLRQFRVGKDFSIFEEKTQGRGTWSKAVKGPVHEFCGTAYFFARELRQKLDVPVAILACNLGGTKVEPWIPMEAYQNNAPNKAVYDAEIKVVKEKIATWNQDAEDTAFAKEIAEWKVKAEAAKKKGENEPGKPRRKEHPSRDKQVPSTLYNAMIRPMAPYALKGAIWYQGESNGNNIPEEYALRLEALAEGWGKAWQQNEFHFYYCQLANYKDAVEEPLDSVDGWVIVQNQQRLALDLIPNSGMAVLNDIGEAKDIHPKNKVDAGKRLSLWALKQAYNHDVVCSGPIYKSAKVKGNKMRIKFDHVGSGLMVGQKHLMEATMEVDEPLNRFQICGADREWYWAEAKIKGKNKVVVWHNVIDNPVEVRYAWAANPKGANLYNKEGLPASVFITQQ